MLQRDDFRGRNSENSRKEKDSRSTSSNRNTGSSRSARSSRNTGSNRSTNSSRSTSSSRNTSSRSTGGRNTGIQRGSGVSKREYNMQYSAQDELDNILKREADEIRKNDERTSENKFYTKSTDYGRIKPARNRYTNMDDLDNDIKKTQGFSDSIVQFRFDTTPYVNEKQARSMKRMQQNVDDHKRELEIYKTDLMFGRAKFDEPGTGASQPTNEYELDSIVNDARQKPVIQQNTVNPTTRQTSATPMHDREIAALQDELVNNPNMGYRDRQDYERMIGRLQEEKASMTAEAQEQSVTRSGGTAGRTLFSVNGDDAVRVGLDDDPDDIVNNYEAVEDEPEEEKLTIEELTEINNEIQADIDYNNEMTSPDNFLDDELIANAELSELRGWQITERKQMDTDAALAEIDKQMAEEIAYFDNLKNETYQTAYKTFEEKYHNPKYTVLIEGQIKSAFKLYDLDGYSEADLKQAFAESSWILDSASTVSREEFIKNLTPKYDGLKEEAVAAIDDEFKPYEQLDELGLSDLWEIQSYVEENSGAKMILQDVLNPSNIENLHNVSINSLEVNNLFDTLKLRELDAEKYDEPKKTLEEINTSIAELITAPLGVVGDIVEGTIDLSETIKDYNESSDVEVLLAEYIDVGSYVQYNIAGSSLNNSSDYRITIEVDGDGSFVQPPHIYVTKWSVTTSTPMFYMHEPEYYEIR